jgi:hypothetical protein
MSVVIELNAKYEAKKAGAMLSLVCHLKFPNHGTKFWDLLERVMPDWRKRKNKLERHTA